MPRKLTPEELEAREARLPAWARHELAMLRRNRDHYRDNAIDLRRGLYGPEDTNTIADPYDEQPINLPKGATIEFTLGPNYEDKIRVRVIGDRLDVNGNGAVYVRPQAGNSLYIKGGAL